MARIVTTTLLIAACATGTHFLFNHGEHSNVWLDIAIWVPLYVLALIMPSMKGDESTANSEIFPGLR